VTNVKADVDVDVSAWLMLKLRVADRDVSGQG